MQTDGTFGDAQFVHIRKEKILRRRFFHPQDIQRVFVNAEGKLGLTVIDRLSNFLGDGLVQRRNGVDVGTVTVMLGLINKGRLFHLKFLE